jgi:hypothetical protein
MTHWIEWIVTEVKRLRWSFLHHHHSHQCKIHGRDRDAFVHHLRAVIRCKREMKSL